MNRAMGSVIVLGFCIMCVGAQNVGDTLLACQPGTSSEAAPYGVPSYWSWVAGAVVGDDLNHSDPYTHVNYWGAVFRGESNTTPSNTEVQIANTTFWVLYHGATSWVKIQGQTPPNLGGGTFSPTYEGGGPNATLRHTTEGTFVVPAPGYIWHFWYGNSYQPCDNNIREMLVNSQVRLVKKNAGGTDDRAQADYLIHLGADMRNPGDPGCANDGYVCPSFGVGKFFRVTSNWRNVSFHSVTQADINAGVPLPPASIMASPAVTTVSQPGVVVASALATRAAYRRVVDLRGRVLPARTGAGVVFCAANNVSLRPRP